MIVATPFVAGPELEAWPLRVAVVVYGSNVDYSPLPLVMSNRAGGVYAWMRVDSPKDLQRWAGGNAVRV